MKTLSLLVAFLALSQTGCQEAVTATPIDPPKLMPATFAQAEEVEARLKFWSSFDDNKRQEALVEQAAQATTEIFASPRQWPDCDKLFDLSDQLLDSGTIYGITQAPMYRQRAVGMGCALENEVELEKHYSAAFEDFFEGNKLEVSEKDRQQAARYLSFKSRQGMETCAYHSMRLSRENDLPFDQAIAGVKSDCQRPPR